MLAFWGFVKPPRDLTRVWEASTFLVTDGNGVKLFVGSGSVEFVPDDRRAVSGIARSLTPLPEPLPSQVKVWKAEVHQPTRNSWARIDLHGTFDEMDFVWVLE